MENMEENFSTKFDKRKPKGNHTPKFSQSAYKQIWLVITEKIAYTIYVSIYKKCSMKKGSEDARRNYFVSWKQEYR